MRKSQKECQHMTDQYRTSVAIEGLEVYEYTVLGCLYQPYKTVATYREDCFVVDGHTIAQRFRTAGYKGIDFFDVKRSQPCTLEEFVTALPEQYVCFRKYKVILGRGNVGGQVVRVSGELYGYPGDKGYFEPYEYLTYINGTIITSEDARARVLAMHRGKTKEERMEMVREYDRIVITRLGDWLPYLNNCDNIVLESSQE